MGRLPPTPIKKQPISELAAVAVIRLRLVRSCDDISYSVRLLQQPLRIVTVLHAVSVNGDTKALSRL